jgi:uncharacterized phage protein gp47/JayE
MALDVLPGVVIVKTRDQFLVQYLRSHQLRAPLASVDLDSEPYVTGSAIADVANILSQNAQAIGRSIPLASVSGKDLDALLKSLGLAPRYPETGSQGAVIPTTSLGGANIPATITECTDQTGQIFYVTVTGLYINPSGLQGVANVPIAAKSTGPTTNLAAGTKLTWSAPPGGLVSTCIVVTQSDGSGLSGGRLGETDDEVRNRISDAYANPPAAGNDAAYQAAIELSQGHGVAVQKAFTYPAALGPGTTAFCFTLSPANPGSSRLPNSTQLQQVHDYIVGQFPGDDGLFACVLLAQNIDIVLQVTWADGAASWVDAVPWPPYCTTVATPSAFVVSAVTSPVAFSVDCISGLRAGAIAPQSGNNIAVYDPVAGTFRQKRILTSTPLGGGGTTGPWALTIDTTNGVSDTTFTPAINQRVCPWSDSLDALIPPVLEYFIGMGPGEQFSTFFDPGMRQKRNPPSPRFWPSVITSRLTADVLSLDAIEDAVVIEGLGQHTTVGTPGTTSYLIELSHLTAFAQ